jgi:UDP:flavonoid glycosyltransferase YjiC (YdhE family)
MVGVPQHFEQLRNARAAQGGITILDDRCYGREVTGPELRTALQKVLSDPSYREESKRLGESLRAGGGAAAAADVIERVALRRSARVQPQAAIRTTADEA